MTDFRNITTGQRYFIQKMDRNNNKTVSLDELKQAMDRDGDQSLDGDEINLFALKAKANGFDQLQIKTMMGVGIVAEATLPLFSEKEGTWQASQELKELEDKKITTIPFSRDSIDSYDEKALNEIEKGFLRVQWQHGNSCGTTSLSTLMKYFQGHTVENNVKTIDKYTRGKGTLEWVYLGMKKGGTEVDGYTAPRDIVKYANQHGMRAGIKNHAQLNDVLKLLDQGVPCLCLAEWNFDSQGSRFARQANPVGDVASLHWVNVIGYMNQLNPDTGQEELTFIVSNPHGKIQEIPYSDFEKVWSGTGKNGHEVSLGEKAKVQTGIQRLFVAMVPQDNEAEFLKPNGEISRAGDIDIPDENDGIAGKLASMGSELLNDAFKTKEKIIEITAQMDHEVRDAYQHGGIKEAFNAFFNGDQQAMDTIRAEMKTMLPHQKVAVIQELLDMAFTRNNHENLVYELLKDTYSWYDFHEVIKGLNTTQLAQELDNDYQAGNVLAWIARAESESNGFPGAKFESFISHISREHRAEALSVFLENENMTEENIFQKIPASIVKGTIENLLKKRTDKVDEKVIYQLLEKSSWEQFQQISAQIDMNDLAREISSAEQLGEITSWSIQIAANFGQWSHLAEILTRLETPQDYMRADDVIGYALNNADITSDIIAKIPPQLRARMKNLVNDVSRFRSKLAVQAYQKLK